jgi:mersacidin/lichenicidin family type 2 lantibiotic
MSKRDIIRAWKDPEYRLSLNESERALLPDHPAGLIELTDAELDGVAGGRAKLRTTISDCFVLC